MQIYRAMTERPLLDIAASPTDPSPPVKNVQWSPTQPGLFFVLDANSRYDPLALLALIDFYRTYIKQVVFGIYLTCMVPNLLQLNRHYVRT